MPHKTKSQLMAENATLRARLAELENKSTERPAGERTISESDMADRKREEAVLKASEVRYRRLFETAKDGILILDGETGEINDANPFLVDMLGYSHAELLGRTLWEIGPFQDIAASQAAFQELQSKDYIRYEDLPLETKGGERRHVEFVSNVYLVEDRKVVQCNVRDITERKVAENSVRQANEELSAMVTALKSRDSEMRLITRMNDLLQSCRAQEEAYQVVSLTLSELFSGQNGCLATLHSSGQYLETVARWGDEALVETIFSLEDCWAMRRGRPHEVADPNSGLLCRHFIHPPETGYLCLPLMVQGETLGVFYLGASPTRNGEARVNQYQLAVTVGEAIKLSFSNLRLRERLRSQATRDRLTGLFNRRYLEDSLPRELHRALRSDAPLSLAMLDLDHFKRFNDTYGHDAGDVMLRESGRVLRDNLRKSDIACRYGGEEFLVVLPDSSVEETRQRIEQIRLLFKEIQIRYGHELLGTMTVSAGIAGVPQHGSTPDELLRAADNALYAAKKAGRNCVSLPREQVMGFTPLPLSDSGPKLAGRETEDFGEI